jgi:lysine-N-methylase
VTGELPARPRLSERAWLRRHLTDGRERTFVHDAATGGLLELDREAELVALAADGTRDVEGLRLAVGAELGAATVEGVLEVLTALDAQGLLVDGPPPRGANAASGNVDERTEDVRPLERLPGHRFACSGRGSCCRQYASIVVTQGDLVRARRAGLRVLPGALPGDADEERVLSPLAGSVAGGRFAMALVDGACRELEDDGRCGLHVRGGLLAKPAGCRTYPAALVDDGVTVRVALGLECDCAFDRAPVDGAPLLPEAHTTRDVRDVPVRRLREQIPFTDASSVTPAELRRWADEARAALPRSGLPQHLDELARALPASTPRNAKPYAPVHLALAVRALAEKMRAAAHAAAAWRSERDRTRRLREAVAACAEGLAGEPFLAALADEALADDERFAVDVVLFGHLAAGDAPVSRRLLQLAAELVVARTLRATRPELGHPIAAVLAATRHS